MTNFKKLLNKSLGKKWAGMAGDRIYISFILFLIFYNSAFTQEKIIISGATTIQSLAEDIGKHYEKKTGSLISVTGGGSGMGIKNVLGKKSDIGMVSRDLTESEKLELSYSTIAYDALVIIVNKDLPIEKIDKSKIIKIFNGEIKSWKELCDYDDKIILVSKEIGRATLDLFEHYSGLNHPGKSKAGINGYISKTNLEIAANIEAATLVAGIKNAIGYVSFGTVIKLLEKGMQLKILELDGVRPSSGSIIDHSYPVFRELNLVYLNSTPKITGFINQFYSNDGISIVENSGFIPIKNKE